jgi:hypothetical protein
MKSTREGTSILTFSDSLRAKGEHNKISIVIKKNKTQIHTSSSNELKKVNDEHVAQKEHLENDLNMKQESTQMNCDFNEDSQERPNHYNQNSIVLQKFKPCKACGALNSSRELNQTRSAQNTSREVKSDSVGIQVGKPFYEWLKSRKPNMQKTQTFLQDKIYPSTTKYWYHVKNPYTRNIQTPGKATIKFRLH